MRRQRLLRTSSTQSLCIFCACRLTGDFPIAASRPLFTQQQRGLANTLPRTQGAVPAGAPNQTNDNRSSWTGFDPNSSLSASEQREKALLRQRREAVEQQRREETERRAAEERARRDAEDKRRWDEDQARLQAQQRQKDPRRRQAASHRDGTAKELRTGFRKVRFDNGLQEDNVSSKTVDNVGKGPGPRIRLHEASRESRPMVKAKDNQRSRPVRDPAGAQQDSRSRRETGEEVMPWRRDASRSQPQQAAKKQTRAEKLPPKVAMPTFLKSSKPADAPQPVASGWGAGTTERKTLVHAEEAPAPTGFSGAQDNGYLENRNVRSTLEASPPRSDEYGTNDFYVQDDSTYTPGYTQHWDAVDTETQKWSISRTSPKEPSSAPTSAAAPAKHANADAQSIQDVLNTASESKFPQQESSTPWMQHAGSSERSAFGQAGQYKPPPPRQDSSSKLDQFESPVVSEPVSEPQKSAYWTHETQKGTRGPEAYQRRDTEAQRPAYRTDGGNSYRVTPFNPNEYRGNQDFADEPPQNNWQHLNRRQPESEYQSRPAPPTSTQQSPIYSEEDIDRLFSQHREERTQRAPPPPPPSHASYKPPVAHNSSQSAPSSQQDGFAAAQASSSSFGRETGIIVCARCREEGHAARNCPGPKCYHCGQTGHMARQCPTNASKPIGARREQSQSSEGDVVQQRTGQYRPPPVEESSARDEDDRFARKFGGGQERAMYQDRGSDDPRQMMMERLQQSTPAEAEDEEPEERVLKSRKFRDDEPEKDKKKPGRRGRRDEDEDDDGGRRSRRGRRDVDDEEAASRPSRKLNKREEKEAQKKADRAAERAAQHAEQKNQIKLPEFISVQNLAQAVGVRYEQFVNRLEDLGYDDVFPGKILNTEVSGMIAMEYDLEPVFDTGIGEEEERDLKARPEVDSQDKELLPTRPPVVTIMGHVDHGKTTILDYLRKSSVAAGEAGGITQHIGAFSVPLAASGKTVTFLDTPGHAAFLAMRQRGANVTDIVILVVAADDSVKPQTLEAIKHAKAAGVPMIVAVNKIDKEEADVQRVKQDLARHGVEIEDFGGDTQVVLVSGKTGQGMDELEEAAVTLSEILDHRAENDGAVEGWVLEATTKKAGRVATVLVRRGTLRQGAVIVAGKTWARVRSLRNEAGVAVAEASPGVPVEVDGWRDQPAAGDEVLQAPTEQKATSVVEYRLEKDEREKTAIDTEAINEARRLEQAKREREQAKLKSADPEAEESSTDQEKTTTATGMQEVPFIIKADVSGSAEAVSAYILSISSPLIAPRILHSSVGAVHESDVELASAAGGHIIAFNLPANEGMKGQAEAKGVKVLENNIIYRVLDDVKGVLEDKLPPIITQRVLGEAEIAASFEIGLGGRKKMVIAGCKVRNGLISKGARVRVTRGGERVYDGLITSLKNVKKDVTEMRKGSECGMGFGDWEAFETGDQVQTYEERSEKRKL